MAEVAEAEWIHFSRCLWYALWIRCELDELCQSINLDLGQQKAREKKRFVKRQVRKFFSVHSFQ